VPSFPKKLVRRLALAAGAVTISRLMTQRRWGAVLMYHGVARAPLPIPDWCWVDHDRFHEQMLYLALHCEVVPLTELQPRLREGSATRPLVAITFDDGYRDNYTVAWPILADLGLQASVFLTTDLIDTDRTLWFCRLNDALGRTTAEALHFEDEDGAVTFDLRDVPARARASARLQQRLKRRAPDAIDCAVDRIAVQLLGVADRAVAPDSPYRLLTREQIETMGASGLIRFGAHTDTHTILTRLTPDEQRRRIATSVRRVEQLTGAACTTFAYPNGERDDFDADSVAALRELNIECAVTTIEQPVRRDDAPLQLGRYGIGAEMDLDGFLTTIHHLHAMLRTGRRPPVY
jgi:peptidoglycan/xylan/chitin deacetylase (PgdA/CDA1 family)